jgi:hypothetical protein
VASLYSEWTTLRYGLNYSAADHHEGTEVMFLSNELRAPLGPFITVCFFPAGGYRETRFGFPPRGPIQPCRAGSADRTFGAWRLSRLAEANRSHESKRDSLS